jgi:hypothetical protein
MEEIFVLEWYLQDRRFQNAIVVLELAVKIVKQMKMVGVSMEV